MPRIRPVESWENQFRAKVSYSMTLNGIKNQAELARKMCIPQSTLSRHLKNPAIMSLDELRRLTRTLGMNSEDKGKLI